MTDLEIKVIISLFISVVILFVMVLCYIIAEEKLTQQPKEWNWSTVKLLTSVGAILTVFLILTQLEKLLLC